MKEIKIFLASSIKDLEFDRLAVGDFFRQLNELYVQRDIRFKLIKCDDYDDAVELDGKQTKFDAEIRDSDLVFVIFFKKAGEYTKHEFEVALNSYREAGKPKIVTYIKYVNSLDEATDEVKDFMRYLGCELKHYYNTYQNIDTLKLGIIMQIKLLKLDTEEPYIEDGKIKFNGLDIAAVDSIAMIPERLGLLKSRLSLCDKEYYKLREMWNADKENMTYYKRYCEKAAEKAMLEEQIKLAEKAALDAISVMYENTGKGELSDRQTAAYRAFERGDFIEALDVLDYDEIMEEIDRNAAIGDKVRERLQINVNELLQRIDILMSDGVTGEEAVEIRKIYETVTDIAEKFNLDKEFLSDYANFLYMHNDFEKALVAAKKLKAAYEYDGSGDSDKFASLYNLLGVIYGGLLKFDEAETSFIKAIDLREKSLKKKAEGLPSSQKLLGEADYAFDPPELLMLIDLYSCLGGALTQRTLFGQSEQLLLKAKQLSSDLEIQLKILKLKKQFYFPETLRLLEVESSKIMFDLGLAYYGTGRLDQAENAFLSALTSMSKTSPQSRDPRTESVAYQELAIIYSFKGDPVTTKKYFRQSIDAIRESALANPQADEPFLGQAYCVAGLTLSMLDYDAEAVDYFEQGIAILERSPHADCHSLILALTKGLYGYSMICDGEDIEKGCKLIEDGLSNADELGDGDVDAPTMAMEQMLFKSLNLPLSSENGSNVAVIKATLSSYLGIASFIKGDYEKAMGLLLPQVDVFVKMAEKNPLLYPMVSLLYTTLGSIYQESDDEENIRNIAQNLKSLVANVEKLKDESGDDSASSVYENVLGQIRSVLDSFDIDIDEAAGGDYTITVVDDDKKDE